MNIDYTALSVPVFFILIAVELIYSFYKKLNYYRLNDSISNLSQGIGQQLTGIFMKTVLFFGYTFIYENWRMFSVPTSIVNWLLLFIFADFFYYWFHRMSHQVNALWAAHIVHHQSEEYNLTVALRQSWFQGWFSWVFYLPLAFVGFEPLMFLTVSSFITLYQFWIHTRVIKNMGFLEYIINTPSHHRVHHGSNPKYIDKNHAGTLIIWDKLFGTFQKEEEEVYYGITKPLASWNPVLANFHYWDELLTTAKKSERFIDKLKVFIKPPGWFPKELGGFQYAPEIDVVNYKKYDPKYDYKFTTYLIFQFVIALIIGSVVLFYASTLSMQTLIFAVVFVLFTLVNCGALLDGKSYIIKIEWCRLFLVIFFILSYQVPIMLKLVMGGIYVISFIWFTFLSKKHPLKNED